MKRAIAILLIVAMCLLAVGCYTNIHQVGKGAQGNTQVSKMQWYVLWGLVPINEVNSQAMAAGATDYTIKDQNTFLNYVISYFTSIVTVSCRTTTVTK